MGANVIYWNKLAKERAELRMRIDDRADELGSSNAERARAHLVGQSLITERESRKIREQR